MTHFKDIEREICVTSNIQFLQKIHFEQMSFKITNAKRLNNMIYIIFSECQKREGYLSVVNEPFS